MGLPVLSKKKQVANSIQIKVVLNGKEILEKPGRIK